VWCSGTEGAHDVWRRLLNRVDGDAYHFISDGLVRGSGSALVSVHANATKKQSYL
jgi:hypothetical protein